MRLLMANSSVKRFVGILYDILVKVQNFLFPPDFVILDGEVDLEVTIIFDRPFLDTGRVLGEMDKNKLKFMLNDEDMRFNVS